MPIAIKADHGSAATPVFDPCVPEANPALHQSNQTGSVPIVFTERNSK